MSIEVAVPVLFVQRHSTDYSLPLPANQDPGIIVETKGDLVDQGTLAAVC